MTDRYRPKWEYNDVIVDLLMKITAAMETVSLRNLPIDIEENLKKESILKTVHYSTKIEGNPLSLGDVHDALENLSDNWPDRKEVREVRNYYNALLFLEKKSLQNAPVSQDFIRQLHGVIDAKIPGKRITKTPYRDGQNVIRDSGSGAIAYLPPEANDVPVFMKGLVEWIENRETGSIPVPIIAAIASYRLLTIHPFWDGNGRTARALATYILKKGNYDLKGFYSMEEFYDKNIKRYYDSLQMGLHHNYYFGRNDPDLTPWITYFLEIMADIFERVNKKVSELSSDIPTQQDVFAVLDKRERWVANFIFQKNAVRSSDIVEHFKLDKKTALNWLKDWEKKGFLKRKDLSQKRYIQYILNEKYTK